MSILGTRVVRVEDTQFLTRGATYTDDLTDDRLTGALYMTLVRSPVPHARIVSIDVSQALTAPGVVAVVTGADLGLGNLLMFGNTDENMARPCLATEVVRFVGEPVAAVLTRELYQGADAADLVAVEYEPLPVVVDVHDAVANDVVLFPAAGTNVAVVYGDEETPSDFFADCEVVVTQEMINQRVAAAPLEPRAAAAAWGGDGRVTLFCSSQNAQGIKDELCQWLGIDPQDMRIVLPDVGGGFGAKIGAEAEYAIVVELARRFGRPVRWTESRSENMTGMTHGRAQRQVITIGGDQDGRVKAYRLNVLADAGAYPRIGALLPELTLLMAPGTYDIEKVSGHATVVVTNTTSVGSYRGAGRPEATQAIERAMDMFAHAIGMDPAELRKKNVVSPEKFPFITKAGAEYDSGRYAEAIDLVLATADYQALRAEQLRRRERGDTVQLGIGVSSYVEITAEFQDAEDGSVEVHPDGTVTVLTGTSPHGQGHATSWAMLVSDVLGIPMDAITVKHGDTDLVPRGIGTMGSRSLQIGGTAVRKAADALVELAKQRVAELLEVDPGDLYVDKARAAIAVQGAPGARQVTFAELAAEEKLRADAVWAQKQTFPFGAHVAAVEVDVETGKATLERLWAVDDAGPVLNPLIFDGQRHGGIAQGVGQALLEEVVYDSSGRPLTPTLAEYGIPTVAELPSFDLVGMYTPSPHNPMGYKGIGEAGTIGACPAVQSAVVDAVSYLGVTHIDMPLTAMRVWDAIQQARKESDQ